MLQSASESDVLRSGTGPRAADPHSVRPEVLRCFFSSFCCEKLLQHHFEAIHGSGRSTYIDPYENDPSNDLQCKSLNLRSFVLPLRCS